MTEADETKTNGPKFLTRLAQFLPRLPKPNLAAIRTRFKWIRTARRNQITPGGAWRIWLILAGRGWGKTRTGAEDIANYVLWNAGVRVGVIAPTFADARDVCIEGESGLLRLLPAACVQVWRRSMGDLLLFNGSRVRIYSADEPERLRGPQHHRVWCDELGAWPSREAFDQMLFGLRLGEDPRVIVTTTPRNVPLIRELVGRAGRDVYVTRGKTVDNKKHLAPAVLAQLKARYEGTRLGRQELEAELLEDIEGALWTRDTLEACRARELPPMLRVVVAVDPALSSGARSDETGIVAAGKGSDGFFYVLADRSCRVSPDTWAHRVENLCEEIGAETIVAEVNAGGELVTRILRQFAPDLYVKTVRAVRGKIGRALPVAALYEQGRVRHAGLFTLLEDQMLRFSEDEVERNSPDRVDALVWALTELSGIARGEPHVRRI